MARRKTKEAVETEVLIKSARRCALCYYIVGDLTEKHGQIAHIDQDPSNSSEDNLVFLCMEHHTLYDSKTSQHKNYTDGELKKAKIALEGAIATKEHFKHLGQPKGKRRRKPKLNVVYTIGQCAWSVAGQLQPNGTMRKMMQISFWALFASDAQEALVILEAYPEDTEPEMSSFTFRIEPRRVQRVMVSAFVLPILGTPGQPLRARFILRDQYGRTYYTSKTSFRFISSGIEKQPD